jgi:phosphohistidine phosphatase
MLSLALLRHAKSSWEPSGLDDFDRPLNVRGRTAAPVMGKALTRIPFEPQLILCSPAKRTRETLELLEPSLKPSHEQVVFDDQLYLTSPEMLLSRLRHVPPSRKAVLMIGHNPGLHGLALMLMGTGDAKSISKIEDKFPTGAVALLSFPETAWRDVRPGSGHLEVFLTPRDCAKG